MEQVRAFTPVRGRRVPAARSRTPTGALHDVLLEARLATRVRMLDAMTAIEGDDRRFADGPGRAAAGATTSGTPCCEAYEAYLETIPEAKRQHSVSYGVKDIVGRAGSGSAAPGCARTTCWSRAARRRSRTTSCSR